MVGLIVMRLVGPVEIIWQAIHIFYRGYNGASVKSLCGGNVLD